MNTQTTSSKPARNIEGHPAFPIYRFSAAWHQDKKEGRYYPESWTAGVPEGKFLNSTEFSRMFKEEQTQEQLDTFLAAWWERYHANFSNPVLIKLEAVFYEYECWCLGGFNHMTLDTGQSAAEALRSFEAFVERKKTANAIQQRRNGEDAYCLMGADERWRWRGEYDDSEPPCRCTYCKQQGVIRINH